MGLLQAIAFQLVKPEGVDLRGGCRLHVPAPNVPIVVGSALVSIVAEAGVSNDLDSKVEEYVRWLKS